MTLDKNDMLNSHHLKIILRSLVVFLAHLEWEIVSPIGISYWTKIQKPVFICPTHQGSHTSPHPSAAMIGGVLVTWVLGDDSSSSRETRPWGPSGERLMGMWTKMKSFKDWFAEQRTVLKVVAIGNPFKQEPPELKRGRKKVWPTQN